MLRLLAGALVAAGLSATTSAVSQIRPPSDNELRAAYCIGVVQAQIELQRTMDSFVKNAPPSDAKDKVERQRTDTEQRLARLRSYLLPKIPYLDALALKAAYDRANADAALATAEGERLAKKCGLGAVEKVAACIEREPKTEVTARMADCGDTRWLPF